MQQVYHEKFQRLSFRNEGLSFGAFSTVVGRTTGAEYAKMQLRTVLKELCYLEKWCNGRSIYLEKLRWKIEGNQGN